MSFGVFEVSKPIELRNVTANNSSSSRSSPSATWPNGTSSRSDSRKTSHGSSEQKPQQASAKSDPYRFINSSKPHDLKAVENRRAVRSQAARLQPLQDAGDAVVKAKKRRKHSRLHRNVTFHIDLRVSNACRKAIKRSQEQASEMEELAQADAPCLVRSPDGGWPMPFAKLPARTQAFTPGLMHHYLTVLATDIPELDLFQPGLLRSAWFPMALTEPATFHVILLTSASHYAMINSMQQAVQLLRLRQETLRLINELLLDSKNACTDTAIAAVAKLASYEAQFGDPALYQIHMDGLIRMVMLRGGLSKLGLDGLLMRMLLWIDVNARHLLNTPLYIASSLVDEGEDLPPPNPALYIGGV